MPRTNLALIFAAAIVSFACYKVATRNHYVTAVTSAMNIVRTRYIDEVEDKKLFEGAMQGMLSQLDPYSGYVSPEEFQQFEQTMEGEFEGVGIVVEADEATGNLRVADALIGKPAYAAGIREGDLITAIDGREMKDLPLRDAVKLIRGAPGSSVTLRVLPSVGGEAKDLVLERTTIPLESVLGDARSEDGTWVFRMVEAPQIGYIRIVNFGERTGDELRQALESYRLPGENIEGLVIDLRGNAGGLLDAAVEACDLLLDRGLIVSTRGRQMSHEQYEAEPGAALPADVPIVVLVDKLSASASEIVAACLQDHQRAAVGGQRSWGKGTVQNVIFLAVDGEKSALRLTVGSYLRPSGVEIHKWKDAKESDPWGVRPLPELEFNPTNQQLETLLLARQKRDRIAWDALAAARQEQPAPPPEAAAPPLPPAPVLDDGTEPSAALNEADVVPAIPTPIAETETPSSAEATAAANARRDPSTIDEQLRKAIEYLRARTGEQTSPESPTSGTEAGNEQKERKEAKREEE